MNKLFAGHQLHLVDQVALLAGRKLDLVYASLVHQLRLSPGFFRQGWGDLGVVDFEEDAKLFQSWPPPHFDQQVSTYCCKLDSWCLLLPVKGLLELI